MRTQRASFVLVALLLAVGGWRGAGGASDPAITVGNGDIGGVVTSASGSEAGVWVIAETTDLPTRFAKVVVTDDRGRYLLPDLPQATYRVWVRGYGLVDSQAVTSQAGKTLNLTATPAPNPAAAAQYYPGIYWYSLLRMPRADEFPGTPANGISPFMKTQAYWVDSIKNSCQSCHALGSQGVRTVPALFRDVGTSTDAWRHRMRAGQTMSDMATTLRRLGPERALTMFADWTDRLAAGELPAEKPERPQGIERNMVVTMWDWSTPKSYLHDAISTDKRNPTVNANGPIYGSPEHSTDMVPVLDPVANRATQILHPYRDPNMPTTRDNPHGASSAYWGDETIWDSHTTVHNPILDEKGRVWFTARIRAAANPDYCTDGSKHPSASVVKLDSSGRHLSMYDPRTSQWSLISTCFSTHHLYFAHDSNNTLWFSSGATGDVAGWFNTRIYDETGDEARSQGWTALVLDTNGNGRRDEFVEADQPIDLAKDKRVIVPFYGIQTSPADDSVWGQGMGPGFWAQRREEDRPGYIVRIEPGADPSKTALSELYLPPDGAFGPRGIDLDLNGVAWTALSSGHLASFDRRKCRGPLNGPAAATGTHCPEGWTLYRFPGLQFAGLDPRGSADHAYYVWVDRYNTLGLGANVPIATTNGGESLLALAGGKLVNLRVPYPLGFFTKNVDGRIDDPAAGWKGRGVWTTTGTRAPFHGEGGKAASKVFKVQMRPNALAH